MSEYIFDSHKEDKELKRLKLIEAAFDADSIQFLEKTGVKNGWHCLEIGPGAGSILTWLGDRVGERGLVVGIDKNTKYVDDLNGAPLQIIEGNFSDAHFETSFDLLHCRYVLIHNAEDQDMIPKIKPVLKPGAYIVLEEPDFTSAQLLNDPLDISQGRVNTAICRMFTDMGLNPGYGLTLPQKLEAAGFEITDVVSKIHFASGNSPVAKVMAESTEALHDKYITTGEAGDVDLKEYIANAKDEKYWSVYYSTISVIAKLPS